MANLLDGIQPMLLMGPGPSCVYDEVTEAIGKPTLGHMDPYYIKIMDATKEQLQTLLNTKNRASWMISGTGSSGMETCFVNLVEPGDRVLVLANGFFSERMVEVAERLGADVDVLSFDWGTPLVPERVAEQLKKGPYAIVAMVHSETSTGVRNPAQEIGNLVKPTGALFLVDCITSLGCIPVNMDSWHCDALYSCSQKGLACPPGLAPVSFSDRAMEKVAKRKTRVPNWYLDMSLLLKYWDGTPRVYHHTASSNLLYGMYQALSMILAEGPDAVYARHQAMHERLESGLAKIGLSLFVKPGCRLPQLNTVTIPDTVNDVAVRSRLRNEMLIEIGSGLGPLAGKIWRVGVMGHTARPENVDRLLGALKVCLV